MPPLATLLLYTLAGTTVGLLALLSGIPAAPLAGALLGAGLLSMSGSLEQASWPSGTRTALEIGIGTVIGTGLSRTSLDQLQTGIRCRRRRGRTACGAPDHDSAGLAAGRPSDQPWTVTLPSIP